MRRTGKKKSGRALLGSALGSVLALSVPFAAGGQTVPTPSSGLGGNHNYVIATDCRPLRDLTVTIRITQDIVAGTASVPINFQLNAWSLVTKSEEPIINWQQYMLGVSLNGNYGNTPGHPYINPSLQNWSKSGLQLNSGNKIVSVPVTGARLPRGYELTIALHNDRRGKITGATYSVVDRSGKRRSWKIDLKDISTFKPEYLAPIVAFELNLVGSGFTSGAGTISYAASTPMTVSTSEPSCVETHVRTAETTNSVYSALPPGPSTSFTQTFGVSKPSLINPYRHFPKVPGPTISPPSAAKKGTL